MDAVYAQTWRLEASECRVIAANAENSNTRETFLRMAEIYDQLADRMGDRSDPGETPKKD